MEVSFGSHFVYNCRYHIVLPTKYRRKIFNDGVFEFFKKCTENTLQANPQIQIIEMNHDRDHVHISPARLRPVCVCLFSGVCGCLEYVKT